MDFLKLLRSFEELIFEAATWLWFYPRTLWRIVTRPLATMAYSDAEQSQSEDTRYDDAISPPLLMLITVVLVNALALALHLPQPQGASPVARAVFDSPQNLVLFRSLLFSLIPLVSAASLLRGLRLRLSRETLRPPFYAQCYLAAPWTIAFGVGAAILQRPDLPKILGAVMIAAGGIWFLAAQVRWFASRLSISRPRALAVAVWAIARAATCMLAIVVIVGLV